MTVRIQSLELGKTIWSIAEKRAASTPVYEGSHRQYAANEVGCLGEVVAEKWFEANGIDAVNDNLTTHDYRLPIGITIDVKTKDRTVRPRGNYECSVPLYNHDHQRPDFYLFISLFRDRHDDRDDMRRFSKAYILGAADQYLLGDKGKTWEAGDVDPLNGTKFWTACINLKVVDLIPLVEAAIRWNANR